ncbi:hypothetical protein K3N28_15395 [Glycomyces sp. TRM65418]|uniref:hypothetical protein n=1 Tax=Glycomyces sp. TRM65418 TaxID=2867006 RepID=UPI001CE4EE86|nr:hypothetical protein [Glycomyces sp. TRM65418]MCC3764450.1 hypothetical protein [Glycomyces sp. TRM65418]QZD54125.1 hypothetical protein K3N28_15320 [Glycomyces sp. TRM65418]
MSETAISLSDIPEGVELEDYMAALFQASGYFVEKSLVKSDPADLLELDIFATHYEDDQIFRRLIEVKGGKWGYSDLFKVLGWMKYLNLEHGSFLVSKWNGRQEAPRHMKDFGLDVIAFEDFGVAPDLFESSGYGSIHGTELLDIWRHSYSVERKLVETNLIKSRQGSPGASEANEYYKLINHGTFFATSPEESLLMLYGAYKSHPRLTLGYAMELDGGTFDANAASTVSQSLWNALYKGMHFDLQASMYFEHRARISIIKAAVDYVIENREEGGYLLNKDGSIEWRGILYQTLPSSFHDGVEWLRAQSNFQRFPIFWQQFMWSWGGFYLENLKDREFDMMGRCAGLTKDEVQVALEAFDRFFPTGEWIVKRGSTDLRTVNMTPVVFQGIGAHRRRVEYGLEGGFSRIEHSSIYTPADLTLRNNCTVNFLS